MWNKGFFVLFTNPTVCLGMFFSHFLANWPMEMSSDCLSEGYYNMQWNQYPIWHHTRQTTGRKQFKIFYLGLITSQDHRSKLQPKAPVSLINSVCALCLWALLTILHCSSSRAYSLIATMSFDNSNDTSLYLISRRDMKIART